MTTGVQTLVPTDTLFGGSDLAISRDEATIFSVDAPDLFRIDLGTGAVVLLGGGGTLPTGAGGLAVDENGDLWSVDGATGDLLRIDPEDGSFSVVGSDPDLVGTRIGGLAPAYPVPEPMSGSLLLVGLVLARAWGRSRHRVDGARVPLREGRGDRRLGGLAEASFPPARRSPARRLPAPGWAGSEAPGSGW